MGSTAGLPGLPAGWEREAGMLFAVSPLPRPPPAAAPPSGEVNRPAASRTPPRARFRGGSGGSGRAAAASNSTSTSTSTSTSGSAAVG